ncbi:hypothetical protein CDAR_605731 [Caerostris darwini]|uniref:Uncharacterized protein n=1 Tax=Caerostris darwini TaxID=1538125 RepID=A0AAV4UA60_9ARAC|nr:hypothetical protein CDAR_605731 [Caerostris darwini]
MLINKFIYGNRNPLILSRHLSRHFAPARHRVWKRANNSCRIPHSFRPSKRLGQKIFRLSFADITFRPLICMSYCGGERALWNCYCVCNPFPLNVDLNQNCYLRLEVEGEGFWISLRFLGGDRTE